MELFVYSPISELTSNANKKTTINVTIIVAKVLNKHLKNDTSFWVVACIMTLYNKHPGIIKTYRSTNNDVINCSSINNYSFKVNNDFIR